MAKIVITADTEENTILVSVDGEKFENVESASVGVYETYDEELKTMVSVQIAPEKVSHLTKRVYVTSSEKTEALAAIAAKKATAVTKDGKIVKFETQSNYSDSVAKLLGHK